MKEKDFLKLLLERTAGKMKSCYSTKLHMTVRLQKEQRRAKVASVYNQCITSSIYSTADKNPMDFARHC